MVKLDINAHIVIEGETLEDAEDRLIEMCDDAPGVELMSWRDKVQVVDAPRVLTLDEILTTGGAGWLEDHIITDGGVLGQTLTCCAWLHGFVTDADGFHLDGSYLRAHYNKPRGLRVWNLKPTDEQRKAAAWESGEE